MHNTANYCCRKRAKQSNHTTLLTVTWTVVGREQSNLIDNTACYDLAKWLSHYLYFFFFLFLFGLTIQESNMGKYHMISVGN